MVPAVCPKVLGVPQLPCLLLGWCREPRNFPFLQSKRMAWPESWRAGAALQCLGGFALLSAVSKHLGTAGWQDGLVNVCDAKGAHNSRPQHAAGSQPLPGGLHICPACLPCTGARPGRGQVWPQPPGGQGRGSVLSGLSPPEPTALGCAQSHPALSLPSRRGFQAGMPLPVRPRAAPPGTALHKARAPLAAEEAWWSPSLSEWEGGE